MNALDFLKASSDRKCGECTECCTVLPMTEFSKPQWCDCKHLKGNCSIYDARPPVCKDYACCWLDGHLPEEMQPNRIGIVVGYEHLPHLWIVEARPGAIKENVNKIRPVLSSLIKKYDLGLMLWIGYGAVLPCDFELSEEYRQVGVAPKNPAMIGNDKQKVYSGSSEEVFRAVLNLSKDFALKKYNAIPVHPIKATKSLPLIT